MVQVYKYLRIETPKSAHIQSQLFDPVVNVVLVKI